MFHNMPQHGPFPQPLSKPAGVAAATGVLSKARQKLQNSFSKTRYFICCLQLSRGQINTGHKDRRMGPNIPAFNDPGFEDDHNEKPP